MLTQNPIHPRTAQRYLAYCNLVVKIGCQCRLDCSLLGAIAMHYAYLGLGLALVFSET